MPWHTRITQHKFRDWRQTFQKTLNATKRVCDVHGKKKEKNDSKSAFSVAKTLPFWLVSQYSLLFKRTSTWHVACGLFEIWQNARAQKRRGNDTAKSKLFAFGERLTRIQMEECDFKIVKFLWSSGKYLHRENETNKKIVDCDWKSFFATNDSLVWPCWLYRSIVASRAESIDSYKFENLTITPDFFVIGHTTTKMSQSPECVDSLATGRPLPIASAFRLILK